MTWSRVLSRNDLHGDYPTFATADMCKGAIRGDLRRLEQDQRDDEHLLHYARLAGITMPQAKAVLDAFFESKH